MVVLSSAGKSHSSIRRKTKAKSSKGDTLSPSVSVVPSDAPSSSPTTVLQTCQAKNEAQLIEMEALEQKIVWLEQFTENVCFTGNATEVTELCDGNCCAGTDACSNWNGDNTVCYGSCIGDDSCANLGSNIKIETFSCLNDGACNFLGQRGTTPGVASTVATRSCVGKYSCGFVGNNKATFISIGSNSCVGRNSCSDVGLQKAASILIGNGTCIDLESCKDVGRDFVETISLLDGSCSAEKACVKLAVVARFKAITVARDTCTEPEDCEKCADNECNDEEQLFIQNKTDCVAYER